MKNFETPLAITMGDPSGIGPEIILKSVVETKLNNFLIFGDSLVFDSLIKSLGLPLTINKISELSEAIFDASRVSVDDPIQAWDVHNEKLRKKTSWLNEKNFKAL